MNIHQRSRLLLYAAAFLFLFSLVLTLAPAVRERTWDVEYRWTHWIGYLVWGLTAHFVQRATGKLIPDGDHFLLHAASLLAGWGLLTIFRLDPIFGLRQTVWLAVAAGLYAFILKFPGDLAQLAKYKYIALTAGLSLTALTLVLGANPAGSGPRLWLGAMGIYLQPSEPLKILLLVYLAAYLAHRLPDEVYEGPPHKGRRFFSFPLIIPTLVMTGGSLLILLIQRDLGTASIFLALYIVMLFAASGKRRVLLLAAIAFALAGLGGYFFIDIITIRLEAWLNPWLDPSGRSYQIVQSLLAIANGEMIGRGPGLGSPSLVPVAVSDFIFSAIAEETGLIGTIALLLLIGLILARGLRAALQATDRFQRLLATGLTAYFGIQSLLILGGNLRLLPLTGVTLPFVSYGGSSLLTSFVALACLLRVGSHPEEEPAPLHNPRPFQFLATFFTLGLFACALASGWWAIVRGPDLLNRTDNARRSIADRYVPRGNILDRANQAITVTEGSRPYTRAYLYPPLSPVTGYTDATFGQAGLENAFDNYLRGLQGNPARMILWNQLLYGTPPPGLDLRLSIDLDLQKTADTLLGEHKGAIVLLNAQSGEILVMASHPFYDPNLLNDSILTNPDSPLVNRAAQGMYPIGALLDPLLAALFETSSPSEDSLSALYADLGFYSAPELHLPVGNASLPGADGALRVSPLQLALAASAFSNAGIRPAPRIALAVDTPAQGWVILPTLTEPQPVLSPERAAQIVNSLTPPDSIQWILSGSAREKEKALRWFVTGTPVGWQGSPLTLVVLLEEDNEALATAIAMHLFADAVSP
ncbi:MAG: putative lipid II flippase FtsW [Anaerolineales bacterium]|nr:putative lipid II flippase FtsW [Anaerolineales bacterium]